MTELNKEEFREVVSQNNINLDLTGPSGTYWGQITQNREEFIFPSPVNLPEWLDNTTNWIGEGKTVLEIGPGKADLASRVLSERKKTKEYYIADVSKEILKAAKKRLEPLQRPTRAHFIEADLNDKNSLNELKSSSFDRVILINVFGYLEPDTALKTINRLLQQDGLLRITVGEHESFTKSDDYDPGINRQYVRARKTHDNSGIEPIGHTLSADGKKVPFYGYRRNYSKGELEKILQDNGFTIEQFNTVIIPTDLWLRVRSSHQNTKLNQDEQKLLDTNGGRPIWDIIARKN